MSKSLLLLEKVATCIREGRRHNTSHYKGARSKMTSFVIIRQLSVKSIEFEIIIKFSSSMKILND